MSQEKRLPQVGERWWTREGGLTDALICSDSSETFCFWADNLGQSYTKTGSYWENRKEDRRDLILIHSDATGKIINPEFNGGVPMAATEPTKTKPAKADPVAQAITEAQERLDGLKALLHESNLLAISQGNTKHHAAMVRELRAKWMPEAKKAGKKVK